MVTAIATAAVKPEIKLRRRLTELEREIIDTAAKEVGTVAWEDVRAAARERFLTDKDCLRAIEELLDALSYEVFTGLIGARRQVPVIAEAQPSEAFAVKWKRFMEHVNERHVLLLDMTKADLLAAAEERTKAASTSLIQAELDRRLASKLQDGERVRDRFSVEDVQRMEDEIKSKPLRLAPLRERIALGT